MAPEIRLATANDVETVALVIRRALRETNAEHYPPAVIEELERGYAPDRWIEMMRTRRVLVASAEDRIVGTASFYGRAARAVFVLPGLQGRGIGRQLMAAVERVARESGLAVLAVESSITAEPFYLRLGYVPVRDHHHGGKRTVLMQRPLGA